MGAAAILGIGQDSIDSTVGIERVHVNMIKNDQMNHHQSSSIIINHHQSP